MDDFSFRFIEKETGDYWETKNKFPSGMTGILRMEEVENKDKYITFNVYFYVTRKKNKEPAFREVTGEDGLEPAVWALAKLKEFEESALHLYVGNYDVRIEAFADDDRRWRVYERVLTRRGYSPTMVLGQKTLVKRLERHA